LSSTTTPSSIDVDITTIHRYTTPLFTITHQTSNSLITTSLQTHLKEKKEMKNQSPSSPYLSY
jgi:hypothetical protein